jgi:uncharacterized protein YcbK (DUF882 family)
LTSVFRTPDYNKECGGVKGSQHLAGRAADVSCPFGLTFDQFRDGVLGIAGRNVSRIRYVKAYRHQGFIHLDIRPTEELVVEDADP